MLNIETMLQKVKIKQQIAPEDTAQDTVIKLMLEDAMAAITDHCRRRSFPAQLEYVAREIVNQAIDRDNADNVSSIKRGDTQINYNTVISADDFTAKQIKAMARYKKMIIG